MSDNMPEPTKRKLRLDDDGTPYAVCPKCNKRIYSVVLVNREYVTYDVSPDLDEGLTFDEEDRDADLDFDAVFTCPECHEVLATSQDEAEALFYEPEPEQETAQEQGVSPAPDNEVRA